MDGVSQVRRLNFHGCVETYADARAAVEAIVEGRVWEGPAGGGAGLGAGEGKATGGGGAAGGDGGGASA
jgi:hypothetical protein